MTDHDITSLIVEFPASKEVLIDLYEKQDYYQIVHDKKLELFCFDNLVDSEQLNQLILEIIELKASIHLTRARIHQVTDSLQKPLFANPPQAENADASRNSVACGSAAFSVEV